MRIKIKKSRLRKTEKRLHGLLRITQITFTLIRVIDIKIRVINNAKQKYYFLSIRIVLNDALHACDAIVPIH